MIIKGRQYGGLDKLGWVVVIPTCPFHLGMATIQVWDGNDSSYSVLFIYFNFLVLFKKLNMTS